MGVEDPLSSLRDSPGAPSIDHAVGGRGGTADTRAISRYVADIRVHRGLGGKRNFCGWRTKGWGWSIQNFHHGGNRVSRCPLFGIPQTTPSAAEEGRRIARLSAGTEIEQKFQVSWES